MNNENIQGNGLPTALPDSLAEEVARLRQRLESQVAQTGIDLPDDMSAQELDFLFAASPFIANACVRKPELLTRLLTNLDTAFDKARLAEQAAAFIGQPQDDTQLKQLMRQFRRQQMLLIAARDLTGRATLDESLGHLSELADQMVRMCLQWYYHDLAQKHGAPQTAAGQPMPLVVLGMGKLGARELNFSSDIDLILAYEADGETQGNKSLSYHEFFMRLARKLYQGLNDVTADGFVFRTDLRLRPYGDSGPLVMSFSAMEEYYVTQGREWERYAMIKARPLGMDVAAGQALVKMLRPFVFRRYLDFSAIESLRELKAMINREVARKDMRDNLKLGPGGIREIEFIAQAFQLMRGGREHDLQDRRTQTISNILGDKAYLEMEDALGLISAYRFLRRSENRIQSMYDHQQHSLPKKEPDQWRLALAMGFDDWSSFVSVLSAHRNHVQACFDNIFAAQEEPDAVDKKCDDLKGVWDQSLSPQAICDLLGTMGFDDAQALQERLGSMRAKGIYLRLSNRGRERLDALMPSLIALCARQAQPQETLLRLLKLIEAIAGREVYLALLLENSTALKQLVRLCANSAWIAETLLKFPVLLDELIDPRALYHPPGRQEMIVEMTRLLADLDENDLEQQMERLRQFKQAQQLRVAAADVTDAMPLMVVSDHLTWIAEIIITVALEIAWSHLTARHGVPGYEAEGEKFNAGFAVLGYGKLGGIELGYGSDLDLVFVHDSRGEAQHTDGDRQLENQVFFTRLAQRLLHILTTLMPSGVLYEVDMRLRPNGDSGLIVTSLESFQRYLLEDAWTWEHQALVRARAIAGDQSVREGFNAIRCKVLGQAREAAQLREDVMQMRQRMRDELDQSDSASFDLKQGHGGIVDIEFMVQYLVLRDAAGQGDLLEWSDNIRLLETAEKIGLLQAGEAADLIDAYRGYRRHLHKQVLQGEKGLAQDKVFAETAARVKSIWDRVFEE
jgi:glutamate-ammonia-ligase adenylyltransferase